MLEKLSPIFTRKIGTLAVLAIACISTSFALGVQSSATVQPFTIIEAGGNETLGDANNDGIVDTQDAIIILEVALGYRPAEVTHLRGDPNEDGKLTVDDALRVLRSIDPS